MKTTNSQLSCYLIEKTIGKGTFGKVKKAIHKYTGQPVAIKILEKNKIKDITDVERVSRELHILKLVRHSSIAQLYEIIQTADTIFIIMQYAQNGQFFDYIMDGMVKSQKEAHYYFVQIVSGLEYLHKMKISHRDIKPQNMLLDVHNRLKIVDFGLSNMYKEAEKLTTACGSPCYASPEMIKGQDYNPELTDVWSLGIVLFTMIMAKLPFEDDNTSVLYSKIKSGLYLIDKKVSSEYKDLLSKLINICPENRLKIQQIKQHPWYRSFSCIDGFGINVGFQKIPIDDKIVKIMENLGFNSLQTRRYLEYNIKNECTATYYLFLKKNFKMGLGSTADICSEHFNKQLVNKIIRKPRHKSIDFNALIERSERQNQEINSVFKDNRERKCISQIKNYRLDTHSISKMSYDGDSRSRKSAKKFNLVNLSTKEKNSLKKDDISLSLQKKSSKKAYKFSIKPDQSDYKLIMNRFVRQNRRLKTDHIRDMQSRQFRQSTNKKQLDISDMFWKKKNKNVSKGQTRYINEQEPKRSKKVLKNNYF